jgi:DNA-binding CsgD family transcriptional regulator
MSCLRFVSLATRISHSDYDAALALVADAAAFHGSVPFGQYTIESLVSLVPADRAGYLEYGTGTHPADSFLVDVPTGECDPADWDADTLANTIDSWPLRDNPCDLARPPLKMSDFLTRRGLRGNSWYCEVMQPNGIEHEIKLWLPGRDGSMCGFFLVRGPRERDFNERDRAVMQLVRPHLDKIRARWERRRRPPMVTRRETEVLELVALGLTNGEIAGRLVVSRATVRMHLENIFEKLHVHTRTAAATCLLDLSAPG